MTQPGNTCQLLANLATWMDGGKKEPQKQKSWVLKRERKRRIVYFLSSPGVLWRINYRDDVSIT